MPRKKFLAHNDWPYHVTARCLNKEWFSLPMETIWDIYSKYLFFIHHSYGVRIHSFVLMNNHFHLIIQTPHGNLSQAMNYLMRETSRVIGFESGRINHIYGGPYYWSLLKSPLYYLHAYKYVYRNPVEAGLCYRVEEYPYSSLYGLLGQAHTIIPLENDEALFSDVYSHLQWLNQGYPSEELKVDIRNALRKQHFHFGLDKDRNSHILEMTLL
ncbi:transposase [Pseudobdellovibrio exovorus]|uniref:Transposase IS200-like domain-containing protein n=1 Tax=Pseudobdellovibrio exovorus JSS TaxID=1184267 RepID=M4VNR6_9BACT|nr:transposase [Pseudobdellovibrio exovorus]AGH94759.1 hypothetical protein A11Q_539 [Pseudobdellovibrio exovorus JSS]